MSDTSTPPPPENKEPVPPLPPPNEEEVVLRSSTLEELEKEIAEPAAPEEIHALGPDDIRARKRPRAVLWAWGFQLACSLLIAIPMHTWARAAWGGHPDGDAVFWRPGGHALMAWLGDQGPSLSTVARTSMIMLLVFGVLGTIVTGALVASLSVGVGNQKKAPKLGFALGVGVSAFGPLIGLGVIAGMLEGFLFGVGYMISSAVDHALENRLGDARSFTVRLVVLGVFVVMLLVVGIVADLGRVIIARNAALGLDRNKTTLRRMGNGLIGGIRAVRGWISRASLAWTWRAMVGFALLMLGARANDFVGERGGGALWILFFFHQALLLGRAALRTSWLANALRIATRK